MISASSPSAVCNVTHYLDEAVRSQPDKPAVIIPLRGRCSRSITYRHRTFAEISAASSHFAHALRLRNVCPGDRVLLMVRPGLDFFALTYALFRLGAIPVLIDPGMGLLNFTRCVEQARPKVLIGIAAAQIVRFLFTKQFRTVEQTFTLGRFGLPGAPSIFALPSHSSIYPIESMDPDETAAVLFTTGSTGPAKGVIYTHRIFATQTEILRNTYGIGSDDLDMPCFPLFGLFSIALGAGTVIPDMDPSHPATVEPLRIIRPINECGITYSFGSPALWLRVSHYCRRHGIKLPSLQKVFMAGAPVPGTLHQELLEHVLSHPDAEIHVPYGATEALPVTTFTGSMAIKETWPKTRKGAGICVGMPIAGIETQVIPINDNPVESCDLDACTPGSIGEIIVRGPVVTRCYDNLPAENQLAKIYTENGFWHRMGDVGYFDEKGRLWFCGRRNHRVCTTDGTLFTVQCEAIFNEHPQVYRSALVGIGQNRKAQTPVIIIEPIRGCFPHRRSRKNLFAAELRAWGSRFGITSKIEAVLFHRSFPVDIRHNAKIRRELLSEWAENQVRAKKEPPCN